MINWEFFTARNFVVIAGIALTWHFLLSPVFNNMGRVNKSDDASND